MDKSLLKKAAIQSLALMIAVIMYSYALDQYQTISIKAVGKSMIQASGSEKPLSPKRTAAVSRSNSEKLKATLTKAQKMVPNADRNVLKNLGNNYLVIKKPTGNNLSLQLKDLYIKRSIQLTITGITDDELTNDTISRVRGDKVFYGDPEYTEHIIKKVSDKDGTPKKEVEKDYGDDLCHAINITTKQDARTNLYTARILIELDRVYAYKTYEDSNYYYIDLRKPSEVYDKILVIDAGHGGKDCGALSTDDKYYEKNLNLDILLDLKKLLDQEKIKVYYTRTGDDTVFLRPREELANEVDCDYFISIHCNANSVSYPNGTEVLYYNNRFKGVRASKLAKLFSSQLGRSITLDNKGTVERHYKDIFIMDKAKVPMILIEVGYVTNNNDINYLSKPENQMDVAKGIYHGILKAYEQLPVDK